MNTRRQFLGIFALYAFAASVIISVFGFLRMILPAIRNNKKIIKISKPGAYPISRFTFVPEARIYVFRERKGIRVLSSLCTHLGCTLTKTDDGFRCPCHGSCYDNTGTVKSGPATINLSWFEISRNRNGYLLVHTDKKTNYDYIYSISEIHE